jgi:hypothetical protein
MRRTLAAFVVLMGLSLYGCADSATINPVAELAGLTVTPGTLQPGFSGGITQYRVDLSSEITSVTIMAQPAVAGDTVTINGQRTTSSMIALGPVGTTTPVSIVVSESGANSKVYTVLLVKADLTGNNSLQNLTVSPGTLTPSFDENLQVYTIDVPNDAGSLTVTPTLSDPAASITVNGQAAVSGQPATISLNPAGQTTAIPIVVTAQNGSEKTYFLAVSRGVSGNNSLQSITISPGSLSPTFNAGTLGYRVPVASNVTSVMVTPALQDTTASMTVSGQATISGQARSIPLNGPGSNTFINIVVAAQNGTQKTYSINVNRAALEGNNRLSALDVSPGSLEPPFQAETLNYSVDMTGTVTSVSVTATKADPNAVMTGDVIAGAGIPNGSSSIQLGGPGTTRVVSITVTAPNQDSKTYTLTIRQGVQASNNNLDGLSVSPGSLTPAFTATRTRYTVSVGSPTASITVTAAPAETSASLEINGQGASAGQAREISLGAEGSQTDIAVRVIPPTGNAKTYRVIANRGSNRGGGNNGGNGNNGRNGSNRGNGNNSGNGNGGDNREEDDNDE